MSLSRPAGSAIIAGMRGQADLIAAGGPQFEAALASHVTGNRLAGGVAGVVYGDELAWSAGAGFANQAARKASDPAMLYAIASITKTFTGTAIMQLRDAGRLDLDDPAVARGKLSLEASRNSAAGAGRPGSGNNRDHMKPNCQLENRADRSR
jgi:CubicO group peptidase (beta-lactamase class C family)